MLQFGVLGPEDAIYWDVVFSLKKAFLGNSNKNFALPPDPTPASFTVTDAKLQSKVFLRSLNSTIYTFYSPVKTFMVRWCSRAYFADVNNIATFFFHAAITSQISFNNDGSSSRFSIIFIASAKPCCNYVAYVTKLCMDCSCTF